MLISSLNREALTKVVNNQMDILQDSHLYPHRLRVQKTNVVKYQKLVSNDQFFHTELYFRT